MIPRRETARPGDRRRPRCDTLPGMNGEGPTFLKRVTAVLRTRQFVVFFAIALYALNVAVPLVSSWLYHRGAFSHVFQNTSGPLADAVAARSLVIAVVCVAYLLAQSWLRCGYIRSLVGPFHLGASSRRQFVSMLGLGVLQEAFAAGSVGVVSLGGQAPLPVLLAVLSGFAFYLILAYADYIIVLDDVGTLTAIARSLQTVRVALLPTALLQMTFLLLSYQADDLLVRHLTDGVAGALPLLLVKCVVMGAVAFFIDVVFVMIYVTVSEARRAGLKD